MSNETPTEPLPAPEPEATTPGAVDTLKLEDGSIAVVFTSRPEGLGAAVFHNITNDNPNILVPLVRGILASLHEEGGADKLIQKGVQSITANATVN